MSRPPIKLEAGPLAPCFHCNTDDNDIRQLTSLRLSVPWAHPRLSRDEAKRYWSFPICQTCLTATLNELAIAMEVISTEIDIPDFQE